VNQVREITVVSAHELEDKRAAIALTADCDMTFEVYVRKSDAYAYEGEDFRITDLDYNDSFVQGVVRRLVEAEIDAVYDRDAREFTSITTYNFTPFDEA
jgi:hypothetical protein